LVRKTMAGHRAPRVNFLTPEGVSYRDTMPGHKSQRYMEESGDARLRRWKERTSEEGEFDAQELFGVFAEFGD
jgi:hypothetical protein